MTATLSPIEVVQAPHIPSSLREPVPKHLHPAFDLSEEHGTISFGFNVGGTPKALHVVSDGRNVRAVEADSCSFGDVHVRFEPAKLLADVESQWGRARLAAFLTPPHQTDQGGLYSRLLTAWQTHVELDHPGKYVIAVCWGLMTYVYPVFQSLPFLHFLGPKGTGKSQALDLLVRLARDGYKSKVTAAVVGDLVKSRRVTLLFDQADHLTPDHVDLFADSYRAGAQRAIVDMDNRGEPHVFETFGPKAFAGTVPLPEDLADRTILISTSPAARILAAVEPDDPELRNLRALSYEWAALTFWKLLPMVVMMREAANDSLVGVEYSALQTYRGRQRDLLLPIEVLMEVLGVPDEDREAARDYYALSQSSTKAELPDDDVRLVRLLADRVGDQAEIAIRSNELLSLLNAPAGGEFNTDEEWNAKKLGKRLKALGVLRCEPKRLDNNQKRLYTIDGNAVRSVATRYGLTE